MSWPGRVAPGFSATIRNTTGSRISDAIVDQFLRHDPFTRVVTECAVATAIVFIAARFESDSLIDFTKVARQVIKQVGYEEPSFSAKTCSIVTSLKELPASEYRHFDEQKLSDGEIEAIAVKNQIRWLGF